MEPDFTNPSWATVSEWLKKEIERLRQENDSVSKTMEETQAMRGEIKALKRLLSLPETTALDKQIASSIFGNV